MSGDSPAGGGSLVSSAEIAEIAGVTRAAVSNWRRRHKDFPAPAQGGGRTALFARADVEAWLARNRRVDEVTTEVLVWRALRDRYGDDILRGIADVADLLAERRPKALTGDLRRLAKDLVAEGTAADAIEGLTERYRSSARRTGAYQVTTPQMVRAIQRFAGSPTGTVLDPACGLGSLLLAAADDPAAKLKGQELNAAAARVAAARLELSGQPDVAIEVGDSLRTDAWPGLKADLVLCEPPVNAADWGREELLLDPRWEFGVPTRAESELAWLQHCYAHVAPGGRAIVAMPASVSYRKAGRRIRAELVRRGILSQVVALPAGMAAAHAFPVQLWVVTRPRESEAVASTVRMVDLSENDPDDPFEVAPEQVVDVPLIELLDEEVTLTPAPYVSARRADRASEYAAARASLETMLERLRDLLPGLGEGPGGLEGTALTVSELARAGLVEVSGGTAVSTSDQVDTDYLVGFLRSPANLRRATSGSGTFRADVPGARIPQLPVHDQRRYGAAFRSLDEFERLLAEVARLGERTATLARDGLTLGALSPDPEDPQ